MSCGLSRREAGGGDTAGGERCAGVPGVMVWRTDQETGEDKLSRL